MKLPTAMGGVSYTSGERFGHSIAIKAAWRWLRLKRRGRRRGQWPRAWSAPGASSFPEEVPIAFGADFHSVGDSTGVVVVDREAAPGDMVVTAPIHWFLPDEVADPPTMTGWPAPRLQCGLEVFQADARDKAEVPVVGLLLLIS